MVLDPLSALGVAGNIVQFVDFAFKLVSKTNELYERGSLIQHQHLHRCAQQILGFNTLLESKLKQVQEDGADYLSSVAIDRSAGDAQNHIIGRDKLNAWDQDEGQDQGKQQHQVTVLLRLALSHCHESTAELLKATSKLVSPGSNSRWQSFRQALSSTMGESALEVTTQRVFQAQQNVVMFLLLYTSSPLMDKAHVLESGFSLEKNILSAVDRSIDSVKAQIDALRLDLDRMDTPKIESFAKTFHDDNAEAFDSVGSELNLALPMTARQRFLKTLTFESINERYDRIALAHTQTLKWVLDPDEKHQEAWDNFPAWLKAMNPTGNIYWVTGKPGSGKSTLMRFLADSDRTSKLLSTWAGPESFQVLKCFFWNPGNVMQRSMEGLLRTLAHQALGNDNVDYHIISAISPLRWHKYMYEKSADSAWSLSELTVLLRDLMTILSKKMKLMLFVDGLDEFGAERADRETLIELFTDLGKSPNIKLCLSSRPWNEFKDVFGVFPHLKLEDLTKQDMQDYVQAELGRSRALKDFASVAKAKVDELQSQLVNKSDGVFLWLFLVTRSLRLAAQDGKQLRKLFEILDQMPPDLDEFFQHMLERMPAQDRIQASRIFQVMIHANSKPRLMDLSFTEEDATTFALLEAIQSETEAEILSRPLALRRRLDSQCMDLLACASTTFRREEEPWDATKVDYLHRTVKDFLETKGPQELLLSYTSVPLDVAWYECNANISQMSFMNKFISDWESAPEARKLTQIERFRKCLQRLWFQSNINSHSAKQVFELAVDTVDPLVKGGSIVPISLPDEDGMTQAARHACRVYVIHRNSVDHKYLLMALAGGFDDIAATYIADLKEYHDLWTYFYASMGWGADHFEVSSCCLLVTLLHKCRPFGNASQAEFALDTFHSAFRVCESMSEPLAYKEFEDACSKVTNLLIKKTEGLIGLKSQLQHLFDYYEKNIRETYSPRNAMSLINNLQKTRKTWNTLTASDAHPITPNKKPFSTPWLRMVSWIKH